jgi:molybdenum cofactor cytidylyltransferase
MKFETVTPQDAIGARLAHSVAAGGRRWRKGEVVSEAVAADLAAAGVASVVASRLEEGDVGEDEAAATLAEAARGEGLRLEPAFTGRCNLFATQAGVLVVDRARIDAVNAVDEAITIATAPAMAMLGYGEMAATVKIIPFSAPADALARAAEQARGALRVAAFRPLKVGVVATLTEGLKPSVVVKTSRVLAERLAPAGARIVAERGVAHRAEDVARALREIAGECELLVIFGASAIADRRDVIPRGLEIAGGVVERLGMPVDPGNLLMLGKLGETPTLGAPGCARSPRENGFDWVLRRLLAGLPVSGEDIRGMGVGGLLKEIASRPQPRDPGEQGDG